MLVGVTVSNMRSVPSEMPYVSYEIDGNQLSQALFYESIYALVRLLSVALVLRKLPMTYSYAPQEGTEENGWVKIEAPQQPNLVNGEWVPYSAYMNKSHLVPVAAFPSYNLVVVSNVLQASENALTPKTAQVILPHLGCRSL